MRLKPLALLWMALFFLGPIVFGLGFFFKDVLLVRFYWSSRPWAQVVVSLDELFQSASYTSLRKRLPLLAPLVQNQQESHMLLKRAYQLGRETSDYQSLYSLSLFFKENFPSSLASAAYTYAALHTATWDDSQSHVLNKDFLSLRRLAILREFSQDSQANTLTLTFDQGEDSRLSADLLNTLNSIFEDLPFQRNLLVYCLLQNNWECVQQHYQPDLPINSPFKEQWYLDYMLENFDHLAFYMNLEEPTTEDLILQADIFLKTGQFDLAFKAHKTLFSLVNDRQIQLSQTLLFKIYLNFALLLEQQGLLKQKEEILQAASVKFPRSVTIATHIYQHYRSNGRFHEAQLLHKEWISDRWYRLIYYYTYGTEGSYSIPFLTREFFDAFYSHYGSPEIFYLMLWLIRQDQTNILYEFMPYFEKIVNVNFEFIPSSPEERILFDQDFIYQFALLKSVSHLLEKDYQKALKSLDRGFLPAYFPYVYHLRALIFFKLQNYYQSIIFFERALKLFNRRILVSQQEIENKAQLLYFLALSYHHFHRQQAVPAADESGGLNQTLYPNEDPLEPFYVSFLEDPILAKERTKELLEEALLLNPHYVDANILRFNLGYT